MPDAALHTRAGTRGFDDPAIRAGAAQALADAHAALAGVATRRPLGTLARRLRNGRMSSHLLLDTYRRIGAVPYPAAYRAGWHGLDGPGRQMVVGMLS